MSSNDIPYGQFVDTDPFDEWFEAEKGIDDECDYDSFDDDKGSI